MMIRQFSPKQLHLVWWPLVCLLQDYNTSAHSFSLQPTSNINIWLRFVIQTESISYPNHFRNNAWIGPSLEFPLVQNIGVRRGVSKRVDDGRMPPTLGQFRGGPLAGNWRVGHGGPWWNFRESIATPCHTPMCRTVEQTGTLAKQKHFLICDVISWKSRSKALPSKVRSFRGGRTGHGGLGSQ
jgi:hypothetical protein